MDQMSTGNARLDCKDRNSDEIYPNLLDVGSCSLHVVHGAFRTGMKQNRLGNRSAVKNHYTVIYMRHQQEEKITSK